MVSQGTLPDPVNLIIQTSDGLQAEDRQMLDTLGGKLKDDLWIIKGFSASLPARGLEAVVLPDRVTHVHLDGDVGH